MTRTIRRCAIFAACMLLSACSIGSGQAEDGIDDTTTSAETLSSIEPVEAASSELNDLDLFGEDFLRRMGSLQLGIDLAIEDSVQQCMAAEGFEYRQTSMAVLAENLGMRGISDSSSEEHDYFDSAIRALEAIEQAVDSESPDPNSAHVETLPEAEQDAWFEQANDCFVSSSQEHENPLASDSNWFSVASEEASERTSASPEVVAASEEFDRCMRDAGFGDLEQQAGDLFAAAEAIWSEYQSGSLSLDEARESLQDVAEDEKTLSVKFGECDGPRREIVERVYAANVRTIAERDADKATLWAAEFRAEIESYLLDL